MSAAVQQRAPQAVQVQSTGKLVDLPHPLYGSMLAVAGEFATEAAADAAMEQYRRNYHPLGYGTELSKRRDHRDVVVVTGSRARSCE